jgi:inosine triphosphate pyrophosphatase
MKRYPTGNFLVNGTNSMNNKLPIYITGNQNKADYLARVLELPLEHLKLDLDEIQSSDPVTVVTHKVKQAYERIKKPVLVEDTSLCFNALDGLPGPFIKFFVEAKNGFEVLCRMLDGFDDRSAYATAIYGYYDGQKIRIFTGRLDGTIADHPRGNGGYGWDTIFEPKGYDGLTRAELSKKQDLESYEKIRDTVGLRNYLISL